MLATGWQKGKDLVEGCLFRMFLELVVYQSAVVNIWLTQDLWPTHKMSALNLPITSTPIDSPVETSWCTFFNVIPANKSSNR